MTEEGLEKLRQFFGGYFHQDWIGDAPEPDQIVERFLGDEPDQQKRAQLASLIEEYAATTKDDESLERALFTELWCYYTPSADGLRAGDWMRHVAGLLRANRVRC